MKTSYSIILLMLVPFFILSQEKPPEITNDFTSILAGDTVLVNVLSNDWGMEGHDIEIFFAWNSDGGEVSISDSSIAYYSYYYFAGLDSVRYIIKDIDNSLVSESGYLYIEVNNEGQNHLNVNNILVAVNAFGFQYSTLPDYNNVFEVPAGSGVNSIFLFTLWMGGLDENDDLHLAGERYRQVGADYFVGPVGDFYENQQMIDWNKIWKFDRNQLEYHKNNWWSLDYEPIENIKTWPAHGNTQFGQNSNLAPFIDFDEDGNYDPYAGDVPAIKGDQGLFMIYNDDLNVHGETGGQKIGVEIHATAYAYDCPQDSIFNNSIFFHYDIVNRSDTSYHDFYLTAFLDFDLGNPWDDHVGCDTVLNSFFVYNGDDIDEDTNLYGEIKGYQNHPPAQGITFLNTGLSSFIGLANNGGSMGDPGEVEEYYNMMKGLWKDSTSITYGGNGYGGDTPVKYHFSGNPNNLAEWSEVSAEMDPGDRRGIGTTGPYNLYSEDTIQLDIAFVFARDYDGDNLSSVTLLKERIEELKWFYENDSTPCGLSWSGVDNRSLQSSELKIYPNPTKDYLNIDFGNNTPESYEYSILDLSGRKIDAGEIDVSEKLISIRNLKSGFYILSIKTDKVVFVEKFSKIE